MRLQLNALKKAFTAVGYSSRPEGLSLFGDVGNPTMALETFLAHLMGFDVVVAQFHWSIKSMSRSSPKADLTAICCFLLEDSSNNKKEPTIFERRNKAGRGCGASSTGIILYNAASSTCVRWFFTTLECVTSTVAYCDLR
ncbi:hypothetical protein VNO77_04877 [Canavalia gladiata]|uniref:Uncharacterized protein n=1 Tax=Canavalia gladiata TaxID=3824 RepID=A0AAN9MZC2_CANGL